MKTKRYWINTVRKIRIENETKDVPILAGSDISKSDAENVANDIAAIIQSRIDKNERKSDYESIIKERVSEKIDEDNVVTINRYGAKVLNSTQYSILDLDDYPFELWDIFGATKGTDKKSLILQRFKKKLAKNNSLGDDMRIYETAKGLRVICKKYISPQIPAFRSLMSKFRVDKVYTYLCVKQDCYRARLTPKPHRIKQVPIRIKSPLDCETEVYEQWESEYARKSSSYSVAKLIETIGSDFSSDKVIAYHDRICSCNYSNPLA
jgi:hypothetical protein